METDRQVGVVERFLTERFRSVVVIVATLYAVLTTTYVATLPLVMDEFQGAFAVQQVAAYVPYRDFQPYKTVLGYYLELIPFSLADDVWSRLMVVKWALVAI